MPHHYRPDEARGDLPLNVYEALHDVKLNPFAQIKAKWEFMLKSGVTPAQLGRMDRFYLLTVLLKRKDAFKEWLFLRTREVEADPDGCLDLWAREHYKSTIITFAGVIQEILCDPEITCCIFSYNRPNANKFLGQIKQEFETNELLKEVYADVLYARPDMHSPKWSLDKGITVKRKGNPKEATLEASGLVDGMPTGAHYLLRVYDDVVTKESVNTPEQINKVTEAYSLSDNLGARGVDGKLRDWTIGTRYSFADTYQSLIERKVLKVRLHAATEDGTRDGKPVFLSQEAWEDKKRKQLVADIACQMLLNPASGAQAMFDKVWLRFQDIRPSTLNVYIMVDPAGSKKRESDNTGMAVVGVDAGRNKWLLDGYRHKMGLKERWERMKELRKKWMTTPGVQNVSVGYESYGIPDALDYFEERMEIEGDPFPIVLLQWPRQELGSKDDRVARLEPDFRNGKFFLAAVNRDEQGRLVDTKAQAHMRANGEAHRIFVPISRRDENGAIYTINKAFLDEYLTYPFSRRKDFIDATSRIYDMDPRPPVIVDERMLEAPVFEDGI